MKKLTLGSLLGIALLLGYGCKSEKKADTVETAQEATEAKTDTMADTTQERMEAASEFMTTAASGGLMEVELGRVAEKNASNAEVKAFGKRMVDDHSKANEELKALAAQKNITLPTAPGEEHQKHITDLSGRKGVDFDKNYIGLMEKDHMEDINLFEEAAKNEDMDPDIKAFAQKTLTTLRAHYEEAKKLDEKLNQ